MANEKQEIEIKRVGCAVEKKGIDNRNGIFANKVGKAKIRERKKSDPKKNVFLSYRKKIAYTDNIIGSKPI